ncbi:formylglycine-generating enzyme family protein [Sanguibacter gelidistatuariae]|nr:formylglycine-generating enzyme family protein [Sanguibacter gelidistatuariae]
MEFVQMRTVPGGSFLMGSSRFYADEGPVHPRQVESFEVDVHPVTNVEFAAFVEATGHVTVAERDLDPALYPDVAPADLLPGSLVFVGTPGPVPLDNWRAWWDWAPGASWRRPTGPGSDLEGKDDHPVVQVALADAEAYAAWAGKSLPTEAEWEYASHGGLDVGPYAWGEEPRPEGRLMANTWQGRFPYQNTGALGWVGTSPVGTFPANGYGLLDMIGNVWEWTTTDYAATHVVHSCCSPTPTSDPTTIPRKVLKGGSHLCAPEYCLRYRPAARSPQAVDTSTTHIGFRCVRRPATRA